MLHFQDSKKLQDGLIQAMPFDRLQTIARTKNLSDRIHDGYEL